LSFSDDVRDANERFPKHVEAFKKLFEKYSIHSVDSAWAAIGLLQFREDVSSLGHQVMEQEGGKITLTILFGIIGAALGGAGVAMLGTAFGVPLALVLAIVGLFAGNEADSEGYTATFIRKCKAFVNG
jgi:hypothetical protein